jgi:hypothetical protein
LRERSGDSAGFGEVMTATEAGLQALTMPRPQRTGSAAVE